MIIKPFVDRLGEFNFLEDRFSKPGFEFIVFYGRRRVGKSRLIREFVRDKDFIYLLCEDRKFEYNLNKFNKVIGDFFDIPTPNFGSFRGVFEFLVKQVRGRRVVVAIDEFSYLVKRNPEIVAELQGVVDEFLVDSDVMLVLSGSSVSVMQRLVEYKSPLYGRSTGNINLKPLNFRFLFEWFPGISFEDAVKVFSCTGGVPKYLEFFNGVNVEGEVVRNFFDSNSFLFREMLELLNEELRDVSTYRQILESISVGKNKVTEIANYSFLKPSDVSAYLSNLGDVGFVRRLLPVVGSVKKGKYEVNDVYSLFWFYFVSRFFSEIDSGFSGNAVSNFEKSFNSYLGRVFERVVLDVFPFFGFDFNRVGRWWFKDKEIDLVALNEEKKKVLFGECKWSERVDAEKVISKLVDKAGFVDWFNDERVEEYAVFAKSFSKRINFFEGKKVYCYDLKQIQSKLV